MKYRLFQVVQNPSAQHILKCPDPRINSLFDGYEIEDDILTHLPFEVEVDPLISSDFCFLKGGAFIYNERVYESELFTSFEFSGQTYKLKVVNSEENYFCTNITYCTNILDVKNSIFGQEFENGEKEILKHSFKTRRIELIRSLFKLPQNASREIYCLSPADGHDFRRDYIKEGLLGLSFVELAVYKYKYIDGDYRLVLDQK